MILLPIADLLTSIKILPVKKKHLEPITYKTENFNIPTIPPTPLQKDYLMKKVSLINLGRAQSFFISVAQGFMQKAFSGTCITFKIYKCNTTQMSTAPSFEGAVHPDLPQCKPLRPKLQHTGPWHQDPGQSWCHHLNGGNRSTRRFHCLKLHLVPHHGPRR